MFNKEIKCLTSHQKKNSKKQNQKKKEKKKSKSKNKKREREKKPKQTNKAEPTSTCKQQAQTAYLPPREGVSGPALERWQGDRQGDRGRVTS